MVQRQELLERLLAAHEGYFDVEDTFELAGQTFQGRAQFHSESMQYVLSKKAKIWGANIHEHILFRSLKHLDITTLEELIAFMKTEALSLVELNSEHMTTFLSLVIIAETADTNAKELVRKTKFRKNFSFGLKGWTDLRLALIDLSDSSITTNPQGKELINTLEANLF